MNQKVKAGYNQAAKNYNSEFRDQFSNQIHLQWLVEKLPKDSIILDIGCGAGKPVDTFLIQSGMKVIGLDISEAQIDLARQFVPEASYSIKDMSTLKKGDYLADAVVSFYAIFHTPREKHLQILKTIRDLLRNDGYILITMGASDWEGKEDDFCGTEMYWSHYGSEANIQLVKEAGFEIIKSEIDDAGGENHLIIFAQAKQ